VLADLRPVPDSPWFMVAKVDANEILAEARYRGGIVALFAALFIVLAASVTAYGYRYRQARLYQELYRSEREQREAQEQFRTTLYSIGDAVITTDIGGLVQQMNPVAELLTGWLEAEAKGKPLDEVFHIVNEDSRDVVENPVDRVLREGIVVGLANHTLLISKEGAERPIADSGAPIRDETGAVSGVVLVFSDQTQERMAEQAVKESEERLALAMEASNEGVWDWNMTTNEVHRSPNFFSMLGYEAADFSGRFGDWQNLVHPEDLRLVRHTLEDYIAGKRKTFETEFRMVRKSGDVEWIVSRGKIVTRDEAGKPLRMIGTHTNVTERKRSEEALRESQERNRFLASVIELSSQPFGVGYPDGSLGIANKAYCNLVGYTEDEMRRADWAEDLTAPEYHELESRKLAELVRTGEPVRYEKEYIRKDGSRVPVELLVHVTTDKSGKPIYYYSFITDLTDRKRAEEALKESEARVRMKLDAILSPEGDIGTLNLADVMDATAIQALMDDFFSLTNIGVGILDLEGKILAATGWQEICTKFHRQHPETSRHCLESDTLLSDGLEPGSFKLYRCENNMWDIATPIIVGGKHLGNLFLGQFLFEGESPDHEVFRSQARQFGFDEQQYLAALERVPRWSRETVDTVMAFYARLANMLSTLSYSSIELARSLAQQERLVHALRESEERYRSLFENMPEGLAHCQMFFEDGKPQDFIYLDVNDSFERLTGLKDVVGKKVTEVIPGIRDSNPELFEVYGRVALTGNPERFETYVDSLGIWFSISVYSSEREYFVAVFDNITKRKHAEEKLRQAEHRYRSLFEDAPLIYVITRNEQGVPFISDCNELFLRSVGYSREEIVGHPLADFYSPESREELLERGGYARALAGEFLMGERQLRTRDGRLIPTLLYTATEMDSDGQVIGTRAMFVDITERKRAEEALSKQAEFMTHLMEAIPLPVFFKDVNHTYVGCNNAFAQFVGLPKERIVGKPVFEVVSQETAEIFKQYDETLFRNPGTQVYATSVKRSDESTREVILHKATYGDSDGPVSGLIGVILDITDRKILEQQLLQAQKMEAIGTLAGGIAHDFNNLLQVTLGYSELLLAEKQEDDQEYADLSKIFQAAKSGAELVQRMLTFSRKVEPKPIPLNLNIRIAQVGKLLRRTIPKMIDIQMNLSEDLGEINADPTQMEQVLMNLGVNARDAMPDGGKLKLSTRNVTLDEEYCRYHIGARPGEYVLLTVSDTGHGMDRATIDHIFEPFYTTKELGRGTGLGLAMVYGIVKQHGGYITCYSEVEHGTTFNIYFPALESEVEPDMEKTAVMPAFGTETVLLVDDEELVRDLGARILSKAGYQVLTATNGKEALDLFEKERRQLSLVILDLIMPAMGGKECLKELLKIDPQAKVLIASGFSADASTDETLGLGAKGFVSKPFRFKELLRQVRKTLDQS